MSRKIIATTTLCLLAAASPVLAGGFGRSDQSVSAIFEDGQYAEFSFGMVFPSISGTYPLAAAESGDVGQGYFPLGAAYKNDINDTLSYAIIYDQPFGAKIAYPAGEGIIGGTQATLNSHALTGLLQYNINDNMSVYGGLRGQIFSAESVSVPPVGGYTASADPSTGVGYVVGAAYERKDIALRVALTYNSRINHSLDTTEFGAITSVTDIHTPQSVSLDFQTGVNPKTLVFGSVRWVNWDGVSLAPEQYFGLNGALVEYSNDTITYTLGVGRRFTEQWAGAVQVSYEPGDGGLAPNLGPTDGFVSLGLGATYTMDTGTEITGGLRYVMIGDATSTGAGGATGEFSDNSAIAAGLKISFNF